MANAHAPIAPAQTGGAGRQISRRSPHARRRRVFVIVAVLLVAGVAALANYGPLRAYSDARDRFDSAKAELSALETQKAELQSKLGKLTEAEYLESLAREELSYARPGEELYILTGEDEAVESTASDTEETGGGEEPGFLERILSRLIELF